ncbi:MAG: hypothetical protein RL721_1453 [Candidatus Eisenbacteria bacterium]
MVRGWRTGLWVAGLSLAALTLGWSAWTQSRLPLAEKGRRLAEANGCFTCHGPGGARGVANPGRRDRTVPGFEGDLMMYAESADDVRAWIRDGGTPKRLASAAWRAERDAGALTMPAYGARLGDRAVDALVAYVMAANGSPAPSEPLAATGFERANELGCFGCHGPGGRFAPPNPGSFTGAVPSWDGPEFAELVRDEAEFGQWVRDGRSERFARNPLASAFLDRATLRMPAYERHLHPGDLEALWAYVTWLRSPTADPLRARVEGY